MFILLHPEFGWISEINTMDRILEPTMKQWLSYLNFTIVIQFGKISTYSYEASSLWYEKKPNHFLSILITKHCTKYFFLIVSYIETNQWASKRKFHNKSLKKKMQQTCGKMHWNGNEMLHWKKQIQEKSL